MINDFSNDIALTDKVEKRLRIILNEGSKNIMDFNNMKPEIPSFYDEKKFRLGQQAFHNNIFSMMIAKLCGLVSLLAISTILDVVMFTKKSGTPCLAYRRYAETVLHTCVWHKKDPNGKPNEFLESLKIVRRKHCVAFKRSTEAGVHKPTQLDMALAQFGFVGYIIVCEKYVGINTTPEEMEGVVHLWRVIGSMLGIDDKFNICAGTVEETRALCQRILEEVFVPCLANRNKNEHFDQMGNVLLQSLWPINFGIEPLAYTAFTLHMVSSTARNNNHFIEIDTSFMPFYSWYLLNTYHFVLKYLLRPDAWWSPFFRAIFNTLMRLLEIRERVYKSQYI
ncbi:PREDICTED: uncharacterized protein LOC105153295 [Acromyrmex echinatior]|uniref:ER-bound oxygenase mpaB/mpaB'/Rubber oxygenase catalytic domain-containing protein n=1 Tax=Acromyrmex echinatior TaxID=103372 RepID=F4W753_ACREC|nr:PREDICTED: uncharacterized protein LOC105153295 [Acromyrmex echinatior]EGI69937.1 hypothetical protein G5I_01262 [Acromyrmex echinatior]